MTAQVVVTDRQCDVVVDVERWTRLVLGALGSLDVMFGEMNVLFVDRDEIHRLNLEHMGSDGPTDVLAFPLDGLDSHDESSMIGDVVICPSVAAENAFDVLAEDANGVDTGGDADRINEAVNGELALLVLHGLLHVLGHDHRDDHEAAAMQSLERALLDEHYR